MLRFSNPVRLFDHGWSYAADARKHRSGDLERNLRLWMDTSHLVEFSNKLIFFSACSRVSPQTSCSGRNLEQTCGRCR